MSQTPDATPSRTIGRRSLLTGALLSGIGVVSGAGRAQASGFAGAATATRLASTVKAHPAMLHSRADLGRAAARIDAGTQPWTDGWARLVSNSHSQAGWRARPQAVVYRGSGTPDNSAVMFNDVHAAYQNALRWRIDRTVANGNAARDILNAWSATLTQISGTADRFLAAGIQGYQFANAAELMRGYPGFNLARFQAMMLNVFYPLNDSFMTNHNGAFITNYWANWDLMNTASVLAIGILCDDQAKIDRAATYFLSGPGNGALPNAAPVVYDDGTAQWVEAGRDQGHATLGIGLAGAICEMGWNQGIDLYGALDNRFLRGAEYVAKYNLGQEVPYTPYIWHKGAPGVWSGWETFTAASPASRGTIRPIWASIYNHYARRRNLPCPNIAAMMAVVGTEGGGGNYGPNSGGYDQLGFGTLMGTADIVSR
jgi:hypothetical protein